MALIARIVSAKGGRIEETPLAGEAKLAVPEGAQVEIVDATTGLPVLANASEALQDGLRLEFETPEGDVTLELTGDVDGFAAALADAAAQGSQSPDADAATATATADAGESEGAASVEDGGDDGDDRAGFSPILLGIMGLGALGGIAAAAGGGSGGDSAPARDTTAPAAPDSLDLAAQDDAGSSDSDDVTSATSGLTITGKAEAKSTVELFDGSTSLGTATADASGDFTLDVSLAEGEHSITAKATDAAGNVGAASPALAVTVDATAPTAAIALSTTSLEAGETATVTVTFSEPVTDFSNDDLTVGAGTLSQLASSDGGLTWTATFTPDAEVTDLTNTIALGSSYADAAGNAGTAAASDNYTVETVTFTVEEGEDGAVDFGGAATGPISITVNASDEATFSRGGADADTVVEGISTKVLEVPEGGELNIAIDGAGTSDTFTLNAPNAATLVFTGNGGELDDALSIIIESATDGADLRTLTVDTSGLTGVESIRFVFPEDASDVVKLTADSDLSGFTTIEVSKGGVDLTSVDVAPGTEFIVNSTLIVTLEQFKQMPSLLSVTGLAKLTINLTAEEAETNALEAFLLSDAEKPLLIGATVTVRDPDGEALSLPDGLDAISYPGIPELTDRVDALAGEIDDLSIEDIAGLAAELSTLDASIEALNSLTGEDGAIDDRLTALEGKLADIGETVVAYVDDEIAAVEAQIAGLEIEDIGGLTAKLSALDDAITSLEGASDGLSEAIGQPADADAEPPVAATGLYLHIEQAITAATDALGTEIDGLEGRIDDLAIEDIADLADSLSTLDASIEALNSLTGEDGAIDNRLTALEGKLADIGETVVAYVDDEIAAVEAQIAGLEIEDIGGLTAKLSALDDAITSLEGASDSLSDAIGQPADSDAEPPVAATGLYLHIEQAITAATDALGTEIDGLQDQIDDLAIEDIADLADSLSTLDASIEALNSLTGEDGAIDNRLTALEGKLADIGETVVAYVDDEIAAVEAQIAGLEIEDIGGLTAKLSALDDAITSLEGASDGLSEAIGQPADADAEPPVAATGLYLHIEQAITAATDALGTEIDGLQDQIDNLDADDIDGLSDTLTSLNEAVTALTELTGEDGAIDDRLSDLQSQINALNEALDGLADTVAPTVLDVQLGASGADVDGHLNAGDVVTATVKLSEAVLVSGEPTLALTIGDGEDAHTVQATLTGGAGTDTLTFSYTIGGEDHDATGISIGEDALTIGEDSAITDKAGNALVAAFAGVEDNGGLIVDNAPLEIEARAAEIFGVDGLANLLGGVGVGVMFDETGDYRMVSLSDLGADNELTVPEDSIFLPIDAYLDAVLSEAEGLFTPEWFSEQFEGLSEDTGWLLANATFGGETISFDQSECRILFENYPLMVTEEGLREALKGEVGRANLAEAGVDSIEDFFRDSTIAVDTFNSLMGSTISPDFLARIAGHDPADVRLDVTTPLTVAQATALVEAGFELGVNVNYSISDYFTSVQAALADPDQSVAIGSANGIISHGDELDNIVDMGALAPTVDTSETVIRTELGAGDDIYNAGAASEEIVGEAGADTINLTSGDSFGDPFGDVITYRSAHDGRTGSVVDLAYSLDEDAYREGSTITVTINGHVYSYTTGEDGESPIEALENLAQEVMDKQVGEARVAVGLLYDAGFEELTLVYQDEMTDGVYMVEAGHYFLSATDYFNLFASQAEVTEDDVRAMGVRGGETFTLTSEDYLSIEDENMSSFQGETVLATEASYEAYLADFGGYELEGQAEELAGASIRYRDAADISADEDTATLTITGDVLAGEIRVEAGHDGRYGDQDAIENPGQAPIVSVTFPTDGSDYPALVNDGHGTEFDRELRVTISGRTITAQIDPGEPENSVAALRAAIEAAMEPDAVSAITAAYSTVALDAATTEDTVLSGYSLTLNVNGRSVTLSNEDSATVGELMGAIRAVGGVQSVTLENGSLVVTGEVRGADAASNSVSMSAVEIGGASYEATDTAAVGGSLDGVVDSVSNLGSTLMITGATLESEDSPALTVENAEVDLPGEQGSRIISFSNDDADYYEGGQLRVTINGEEIAADMSAGNAMGSIMSLAIAINEAIGEDSDNSLMLEGATISGATGDVQIQLVSSIEAPDAIDVTGIEQDYRGEAQTATISLEDALQYTAQSGEHAAAADRFADVYFEGGQVHATFTPRVDDGAGGLTDGESVTVSADVGEDAATTAQALADAINAATQQVVHYGFDMGEHAPLTPDTALADTEGSLFSLDVAVDTFEPLIDYLGGGSAVATVGDLLEWLNEQYEGHGVWSLNAAGDGFDLTVAWNAQVTTFAGPEISVEDADLSGNLSLIWTDPATLDFIGHAEANGADITVSAAEVGKDTFHIGDVTLDYEGVHQIATASYDADGNYYDGGTVSLEIDTTPDEDGGLVRVQANMEEGDRQASLQNLVNEINSNVEGGDTAARIVLPGDGELTGGFTNEGDLESGFYVSSWSLTVETGEGPATYSGRGERVVVDGEAQWRPLGGDSQFTDLTDFLSYLSGLDGVGEATLGEDGKITITSDLSGDGAYISASYDIAVDVSGEMDLRLSGSRSDYGSSGALQGVLDYAELGEDGTITLVSDDATDLQFTITDAKMTSEPVRQEAEANYSSDPDDYFEGGKIGVTVNGVTVETDMLMTSATSSLSQFADTFPSSEISQIFTADHVIEDTFVFSMTIDGTTHTQDEFNAYLAGLSLSLAANSEYGEEAATFQNLADWLETLDGVDGVAFDSSQGLVVTYDDGVTGTIDSLGGNAYAGHVPINFGMAFVSPENTPPVGDPEGTVAALRDAIWQQVTNPVAVIDVDDSWTEETPIGSFSFRIEYDGGISSGGVPSTTLGTLLLYLNNDRTSAELVDGKIIVTGDQPDAPVTITIYANDLINGVFHVGSELYGAFSSVEAQEGGDIYFTAADAVDGYGEINISDVSMSLPAVEQITEIDFVDANLAAGLEDDLGQAATINIDIAGQTISAEVGDDHGESVRALAQAIIEARDGSFAETVVGAESADLPASASLELPEGVDGASRVIWDGEGDAPLAIAASFDDGLTTFNYVPGDTFNMSITELVSDLNSQLTTWAEDQFLAPEAVGSFAYDAAANQILLVSNATGAGASAALEADITEFWESDLSPIQTEGVDVELQFSGDEMIPSDGVFASTFIDLPESVTGASLIHLSDGSSSGGTADIHIQVDYGTFYGGYTFIPDLDGLGEYLTVADFVDALNGKLSEAENEIGDLGEFVFDAAERQIEFKPPVDGIEAYSYQVADFDISQFVTSLEAVDGASAFVSDSTEGGSGLIVHSDDQAISADDPISMDPIEVTFTIDGEVQTETYWPDLIETPGEAGSTVGDFMEWAEDSFQVRAEIREGDIVFMGDDGATLEGGEVSLKLLDAMQTVSSEAVDLTGPTGDAPGGVITLDEFAGLGGDDLLVGESVDFELYVGGATAGSTVSVSYEIEDGSTVADLLDYVESYTASETGGHAQLSAELDETGIVLSLNGVDGYSYLQVSDLSLTVENERTGANTAISDVLGEVEYDDGLLELHGASAGVDELNVGNVSYDTVDEANSVLRQVVLEFNNTKLDNVTDGSVIALQLGGETTTVRVNLEGDPAFFELDLSNVAKADRSTAILQELMSRLAIDHGETLSDITRGSINGDGVFVEDASNTANTLVLTSGVYGQEALGALDSIKAIIVDATEVEQFSVTAWEARPGSVSFIGSSENVYIDDGSVGFGGQAGRNESAIHYEDLVGGEGASGSYILDDVTDSDPGVTLTGEDAWDFDYLDIDDDEEAGVSQDVIEQEYVNAGDGGTGTDPSYYGDAARSGEDGVQQTHQNPDGSYSAIDGSPAENADNVSAGEDSHYGASAGYYDEDGLHTDHQDGGTLDPGGYYPADEVSSQMGVTGDYHAERSDGAWSDDGFVIEQSQDGFAAFTWDDALEDVVTNASQEADVINNFRAGDEVIFGVGVYGDVINFEGDLQESTANGELNRVESDSEATPDLSLDTDEFGIVSSEDNTMVGVAELSNAYDIAELLEEVFEVDAETTDSGSDTTIFAVTAGDDPSTTAIWVHQQSWGGDDSIGADELTLLSIVHTTGGEFGAHNLQMVQYQNEPI